MKKQDLITEIKLQLVRGKQILRNDVALGPEFCLDQGHTNLDRYLNSIDDYEEWRAELIELIAQNVRGGERLIETIDELTSPAPFRYVEFDVIGGETLLYEFRSRARYREKAELKNLQWEYKNHLIRETPTHKQKIEDSIEKIARFEFSIARRIEPLPMRGDIQTEEMRIAIERLKERGTFDIGVIEGHISAAEEHYENRNWIEAAIRSRQAVEQIISDIHEDAVRHGKLPKKRKQMHKKVEDLISGGIVKAEVVRYAYGTYGFLSKVGGHSGKNAEEEGEYASMTLRIAIGIISLNI